MNKKKLIKAVDIFFRLWLAGLIAAVLTGAGFEITFWGKNYPGLVVAGISVGGLNGKQTLTKLENAAGATKEIKLVWGVNEWIIPNEEIGLRYDMPGSANKALAWGRVNSWRENLQKKLAAIGKKVDIEPAYTLDEGMLEEKIAMISSQIEIPAREPEITVENGGARLYAGENGRQVEQKKLKIQLKEEIGKLSRSTINVPVTEIRPKLSDDRAKKVQETANAIIGKKLVFKLDQENWEILPEQLISWLDLQSGSWSETKIKTWITELAAAINKPAQNATFHYVGSGRVEEFKPAKEGLVLAEERTLAVTLYSLDKLITGSEDTAEAELVTEKVFPEITTEEVNNLGIKELIGKGESWYSGSITNRIFNLKKAAEAINGILVAPEEIFSFNTAVGEVSANTGYKQAYIIKEGKTILGDGGGVCQVSSTLFRAVLATGLPIEERTAHAYRVHYYEEKYQPGFDATVFQPSPDLKFKNDTGAYILIQAVYDEKNKYLAFEIFGTDDGREVEISKARIWEVTAPPPDLYQDDPTLPAGKIVQTEHAAWGAKVAFDWKVTRGEELLQQRTFYSNYRPWQAVYLRGTKPL